MVAMNDELAPWRSPLARSLHQHRAQPQARYFQLATVAADGKPHNRTVVFRGFCASSNRLRIATDARSEKVAQLQHQSWGEACWYFVKTREQFRLAGPLLVVTHETQTPAAAAEVPAASTDTDGLQQERVRVWQGLSDNARQQFAWPTPGAPRSRAPEAFVPPPPDSEAPPETFCLLLLEPQAVDFLTLKGDPQDRRTYTLDPDSGTWVERIVNP